MRGDGVVEDVDGDFPPQDGRVVGDDDDDLNGSCHSDYYILGCFQS